MALEGTLEELNIVAVLQMIASGGMTGSLRVWDATHRASIAFVQGQIIHADSTLQGDRLGECRHACAVPLGLVTLLERTVDRAQHRPEDVPRAAPESSAGANSYTASSATRRERARRSTATESQIDASKRTRSGTISKTVVTGSTPGSATASAATTT